MCRNIKTLYNFEPPATEAEIRAASVQFVRKISGSTKPSKANEAAFEKAVNDISVVVTELLQFVNHAGETQGPDGRSVKSESAGRQTV